MSLLQYSIIIFLEGSHYNTESLIKELETNKVPTKEKVPSESSTHKIFVKSDVENMITGL